MQQLASAQSISELKYQYRKLAAIHHPDRGGNVVRMQAINAQYDFFHEKLSSNNHCANDEQAYSHGSNGENSYSHGPDGKNSYSHGPDGKNSYSHGPDGENSYSQSTGDENFDCLQKGDFIFINNTLSEVLDITTESFRVVAKGRNRQAWFNLNNGVGRYNSKLRASFNPIPRP